MITAYTADGNELVYEFPQEALAAFAYFFGGLSPERFCSECDRNHANPSHVDLVLHVALIGGGLNAAEAEGLSIVRSTPEVEDGRLARPERDPRMVLAAQIIREALAQRG